MLSSSQQKISIEQIIGSIESDLETTAKTLEGNDAELTKSYLVILEKIQSHENQYPDHEEIKVLKAKTLARIAKFCREQDTHDYVKQFFLIYNQLSVASKGKLQRSVAALTKWQEEEKAKAVSDNTLSTCNKILLTLKDVIRPEFIPNEDERKKASSRLTSLREQLLIFIKNNPNFWPVAPYSTMSVLITQLGYGLYQELTEAFVYHYASQYVIYRSYFNIS